MIPRVGGQTLGIPDLMFIQFLNRFCRQFESVHFAIVVTLSSQSESG
jgi:hypothetical protein